MMWQWGGDGSWNSYSEDLCNDLENARLKNQKEVRVDSERYPSPLPPFSFTTHVPSSRFNINLFNRYVDLKDMKQRRYDNPGRSRPVRRVTEEKVDEPSPSSPASLPFGVAQNEQWLKAYL
jgi:hypothetical protein